MSIDAAPRPFRGPWEGDTKIVIGIDIGTTQSGVAFAFLQNGMRQEIHRVTRWPGQEAHNQQGKIPTVIWYDTNKRAVSFGAEAQLHTTEEQAEDNGWVLAKYFKLHLHPSDMQTRHELKLDPLPPGVSLRQIYSDFLGYLLKHTRTYFEDRILDGKNIWERHSPTMEVVIAHPNGWGIREQAFLRSAAVAAGFATADRASTKVRFVSEAEASVHFCIHHTNLGNVLRPGTNFAVVDAGGSTVDTTLYSVISARPMLKLEEKRASACVQAGAIFVDFEAEKYFRRTLAGAGLSSDDVAEYTKAGIKDFEGFAKRAFKDATTDQSVAVAHTRFNNTAIRARRGRMTLSGSTIKEFFDVCVKEITASVDQQLAGLNVPYILLVGGFGDSPYIRNEFKTRYEPRGSQVALTNDSTSKAVADGAVIWSTLSSVYSRAPRYSFGTDVSILYSPYVHNHQGRVPFTWANGEQRVAGAWSQIVQKGVALDAEAVRRESYYQVYSTASPDLELYTLDLLAYSGDDKPEWALGAQGQMLPRFQKSCTVRANLKNLQGALKSAIGTHGSVYWTLNFDVCIRFGGTELEGYMEWEEGPKWQPALYNQHIGWVYSDEYTEPLFNLLSARSDERIVVLGCGTGELTLRLQKLVGENGLVLGVDGSESMLETAETNGVKNLFHCDIQKLEMPDKFKDLTGTFDGKSQPYTELVGLCKQDPSGPVKTAKTLLKPGGRFVGEFCGYMNGLGLRGVVSQVLKSRGKTASDPWFLPQPAEYTKILESEGFTVEHISLNPHISPLPESLVGFLRALYRISYLKHLNDEEAEEVIHELSRICGFDHKDGTGAWSTMYVTIRFRAIAPM